MPRHKHNLYLICIISPISAFAASSTWSSAYQQYQNNNIQNLQEMAAKNPNDKVVNYLYASAALNKSNTNIAQDFIEKNKSSYLSMDLGHQLLNFAFNNQNWSQYTYVYKLMPDSQTSVNEDCGYDLANYALGIKSEQKIKINELIRNKMTTWCISLAATKLSNNEVNQDYKNYFLYNLLINNQLSQYNQVAPKLNAENVLSVNNGQQNSQYQNVYNISRLAIKSPDQALYQLDTLNINNITKQYLYNLLAYNLATKQMFDLSQQAIDKGNDKFLSNNEYEWRVRTSLATSNWNQVIKIINSMPLSLQNKNTWIYWKAFAMSKLGQKKQAQQQLTKITSGFNFYSLLAQSELSNSLSVKDKSTASNFEQLRYINETQQGFDLYQLGKQTNNSLFTKLGTQTIYYTIGLSNDSDIAAISDKAYSLNMTDIAIYAGTKIKKPDAIRSFPIMYVDQYKKYSSQYGVDYVFPIAITRQESRFNANALAFDGGVGLMQIMPATASYIAKKVGSHNCYKNYECNIQFGTWFLAHLAAKFGGNLIYASAGYNAGPGRAHRWENNFNSMDNRIQIELIPFDITRDYVQKVNTNKLVYDALLNNQPLNMNDYLKQINNKETTYITDDEDLSGDESITTIENSDNN